MLLPEPVLDFVIPALVAFGVTGIVRRAGRGKVPSPLAGIGLPLGFAAGFVGLAGGVPFLAELPHHAVGEVALLATAIGLALATLSLSPGKLRPVLAMLGMLAVAWCFGPARLWLLAPEEMAVAGVAALLGAVMLWRLAALAADGAAPVAILAMMAAALAVIAKEGRASLPEQFAIALVAASVGWLLWARPLAKIQAGAAALLGGGAVLVAVAVDTARTALHPPWALLLLPACLWADWIAARLPVIAGRGRKKAGRPLALSIAAAIPAILAAGVAFALASLLSSA